MNQPWLFILVATLFLGAGYWLSNSIKPPAKLPQDLKATVLEQARPIRSFQLRDHDDKPFVAEDLKNQWSFMFFGYTHCPDVCPTALLIMKAAWPQITHSGSEKSTGFWDILTGSEHKPVKMYFVSVDPDRDSLEILKKYTQYYNPEFIGITGEASELDKLTGQTGILYGYEDKDADSQNYVVNHSAQILLFDPNGNMRAVFSPPYDVDTIISNFAAIRAYFGG